MLLGELADFVSNIVPDTAQAPGDELLESLEPPSP